MIDACATRFDVTGNLKNFANFFELNKSRCSCLISTVLGVQCCYSKHYRSQPFKIVLQTNLIISKIIRT